MKIQEVLNVLNRIHDGKQPLARTPKWILKGLESSKTIAWNTKAEKWALYSAPLTMWV